MSLDFTQFFFELSDDDYRRISNFTQKVEEDPKTHSPWFSHIFDNKMRFKIPLLNEKIKEVEKYVLEPGGRIDWETGRYYGPRSETSIGKKLAKSKAPQELINWVSQMMNMPPEKRKDVIAGDTEIVITRHPADVLRMSDLDGLQSCHSPGKGYFNCAVMDAKTGNMVAYLIKKGTANSEKEKWIKKPDLDNDNWKPQSNLYSFDRGELFKDEKRGVKGIDHAIARLRIRRFEGMVGKTPTQLAVPEERVYPEFNQAFYDTILKWARDSQQDILNRPIEELNKFNLAGGEYLDTDAGTLLDNLFGKPVADEIMGDMSKDLALRVQKQEMDDIQNSEQFKHVETSWKTTVSRGGQRLFTVKMRMPMKFNLPALKGWNDMGTDHLLEEVKKLTWWSKNKNLKEAISRIDGIKREEGQIVFIATEPIWDPQHYSTLMSFFKALDDFHDELRNHVIEWMMHPTQGHGQHDIQDVILKYFDVELRNLNVEGRFSKELIRNTYKPKFADADRRRMGSFYGSVNNGRFEVIARIEISRIYLGMDKFNHIKVDSDYLADPTQAPWKVMLMMLPNDKDMKKEIHVNDDYVTIIADMSLPLNSDVAAAENFMQRVVRLYKLLPYVQQKASVMVMNAFGNADNIENYWYFNKPVTKPFPANKPV